MDDAVLVGPLIDGLLCMGTDCDTSQHNANDNYSDVVFGEHDTYSANECSLAQPNVEHKCELTGISWKFAAAGPWSTSEFPAGECQR